MLFNSFGFVYIYLPIAVLGFFWAARVSHRAAALWVVAASLFFYSWWNPKFVSLLLFSIALNFCSSLAIARARSAARNPRTASRLLILAIAMNLSLLGYFKYANFFLAAVATVGGYAIPPAEIVLPLGISFFTFTQLAYLVDVSRGLARDYDFIHYILFVSYFPHLIAGPILHHAQIIPQFAAPGTYRADYRNIAAGLTIFVLGLAKKVLLADALGPYANAVFDAARDGAQPTLVDSWIGAAAYGLQLYFDFSGYCDMAIGLSLIFNVRLPLNFDSPYKAASIIDFWRRWHMTLSSFLRDYLYIPLGGNRKGARRRYVNLFVTMVLGGLWHGAGWTFVFWGALHGAYLLINHAFRAMKARIIFRPNEILVKCASVGTTFLAVTVAWVFFRADSFPAAWAIVKGMVGANGISLPVSLSGPLSQVTGTGIVVSGIMPLVKERGENPVQVCAMIALCLFIVWFLPNVRQVMKTYRPTWQDIAAPEIEAERSDQYFPAGWLTWRPSLPVAVGLASLLFVSIVYMTRTSTFLYFQF